MKTFKIKPLSFADLRNYRKNIANSKSRIIVEGMRGKSGLVVTLYKLLRARGVKVLGKIT